jgi:hypothetical protein
MNVSPDKEMNSNNEEIKPVFSPPTPPLTAEGDDKVTRKNGGRKRGWKKPRDKPKRPLSAYNLFFQYERERILSDAPDPGAAKPRRSHGKIGFAPLARSIAAKWGKIDSAARSHFEGLAAKDKERYNREMKAWNERMRLTKLAESDTSASNLTGDSMPFALMHRPEPQLPSYKRNMGFRPTQPIYLPQLNEWASSYEVLPVVSEHSVSDESITTETDATVDGVAFGHVTSDDYSISGYVVDEMAEALRMGESTVHHLNKYGDHFGVVSHREGRSHHLRSFQDSFFDRSPSPECVPFPLTHMGRRPSIAELASKLDTDSMDLLSSLLR